MPNLPNLADLLLNPVLVVAGLVWLFAESTKVVTARLNGQPARFFDSGGIPSGHAATICAATTVIGLNQGFASPLFGFAVIVVGIVLHDSFRVRWMAGQTAERINELSKKSAAVAVHRGHRLSEVAVGAGFGVALGATLYYWLYA